MKCYEKLVFPAAFADGSIISRLEDICSSGRKICNYYFMYRSLEGIGVGFSDVWQRRENPFSSDIFQIF